MVHETGAVMKDEAGTEFSVPASFRAYSSCRWTVRLVAVCAALSYLVKELVG